MTLADDLLPTVYEGRAIAGELGFRPHTVALVVRQSEGPYTGDGAIAEVVTAITEAGGQPPRVRWLDDEEIAVGGLSSGTIEVGAITPEHSGGGTALSLLDGSELETGDVRLLRITGPHHPDGADYRIIGITAERPLRIMLRAVPVGAQPAA